MTHKLVAFERSFTKLEKELRKQPDNKFIMDELRTLQADFDKYVWNKRH